MGVDVEKPATARNSAAQTAYRVRFHGGAALEESLRTVSSCGCGGGSIVRSDRL
jgi:hypothetical protein